MRTVAQIDAEILRTDAILQQLKVERIIAWKAATASIIAAIGRGESYKSVAHAHGVPHGTVSSIMYRHYRATGRVKPINHLPADQQRAYHKYRRNGVGKFAARQLATELGGAP